MILKDCKIGDYVLTNKNEIFEITSKRVEDVLLFGADDLTHSNCLIEWNVAGETWNSSIGTRIIKRLLTKEQNPEYWL